MTKIHLISDLHLDHDTELDSEYLAYYTNDDQADICVVAGDAYSTCKPHWTGDLLVMLRKLYQHVVFVPGNHDLWLSTPEDAKEAFESSVGGDENIHFFMEPGLKTIGGVRFLGSTMWYPQPAERKRQDFIDMRQVRCPRSWFFDQHQAFRTTMESEPLEDVVVVTHHLPHPMSTPVMFQGSVHDHFFMTNMTDSIMKLKPKLWLHGHTHDPCDYKIGDTRIVCNPRGYPHEYNARDSYQPKLIEV